MEYEASIYARFYLVHLPTNVHSFCGANRVEGVMRWWGGVAGEEEGKGQQLGRGRGGAQPGRDQHGAQVLRAVRRGG